MAEEKLTLMALRRTAVRLRLDEGASLGEMRAFMDSEEEKRSTKYRLSKLPELPEMEDVEEEDEGGVPNRQAKPFKPGEGIIHGFYARSQPPEQVAAVLRENIQGMGEEIVGLRILGRNLLERQERAKDMRESAQLLEAYTLAAYRLGEVIRAEKELTQEGKTSEQAEEFLAAMDRIAIEHGQEPVSEKARAEALGREPNLEAAARRVVEEIASARLCLRKAFQLAIEAEETRDAIRYEEIYSSGCVRLVKLMRMEQTDAGRLEEYIRDSVDQAIREVTEELGLWV